MAQTNDTSGSGGVFDKLWKLLSSMKLGIILLLVLALASIIGTIWIPRDPFTGQLDYLKFYNHPIFRALMGFLALNLLICSLDRWKVIVSILKRPETNVSENFIQNLKSGTFLKLNTNTDQAAERVQELLKKKGYRVFAEKAEDTVKIASDKGHLGILGPYITHLSFFILLIAVIIKFSGIVGFEGSLTGIPGETYSLSDVQGIQNMDPSEYFDIKIKDFRTEYRPDGSVKQWYSDVTIIDGSKTFDYTIFVNNPLIYKGIKFYQSSYGNFFSGEYSTPMVKGQQFTIGINDYVNPTGTDIYFVPAGFNDVTDKVVLYTYKGNQLIGQDEVSLNTPFKHEQAQVKFTKAGSFTVLTVKNDPSVPVVGIGGILLILGVIISFLLRHKKIWAVINSHDGKTLIRIGGISSKDKPGLDDDIKGIVDGLK